MAIETNFETPPNQLIIDLKKLGYAGDDIDTFINDELEWEFSVLYELYPDKILPYETVEFIIEKMRKDHQTPLSDMPLMDEEVYLVAGDYEYIIYFYCHIVRDQPWYDWEPSSIIGKKEAKYVHAHVSL